MRTSIFSSNLLILALIVGSSLQHTNPSSPPVYQMPHIQSPMGPVQNPLPQFQNLMPQVQQPMPQVQNLQPQRLPQVQPQQNQGFIYPIQPTSPPNCLLGSNPVCGADNQTYPNICILLLLRIEKKSDGWCQTSNSNITIKELTHRSPNNGYLFETQKGDSTCGCNSVYNPVCGKNGVTYASRCRLECSNVAFNASGPCGYYKWAESPHYNCPCPYEFSPVCGGDKSTYENECALKCAHQPLVSEGSCLNPCNCTSTYKPVCGKNGKTYRNNCLLKCDKQETFSKGKCPERKPAHCSYCEGLIDPVCANNGITMENNCYLRCAGLQLYQKGPCPNDPLYSEEDSYKVQLTCNKCKPVVLPVCGVDNKTYQNACSARCKGIKIQYRGNCLYEQKDPNQNKNQANIKLNCNCENNIRLVCGVDGRTYQNQCFANCYSIKVFYHAGCKAEYPGYCNQICKDYEGPVVCGKDYKTYHNKCVAEGCMRIPTLSEGSCTAINFNNHPPSFEYEVVSNMPRVMSNKPAPQPVQAPVQAPVHAPVHASAPAHGQSHQVNLIRE